MTPEQAARFVHDFSDASMALENRRELLEALADSHERDLELVGVTAIEDRLQEVQPLNCR